MSTKCRKTDIFKLFNVEVNNNLVKYVCKYCNKWKTNSNATRMKAHIKNKCKACPKHVIDTFCKEKDVDKSSGSNDFMSQSLSSISAAQHDPNMDSFDSTSLISPPATLSTPTTSLQRVYSRSSSVESNFRPSSCASTLSNFVDIVSKKEQEDLEAHFARFVYGNQLALSITENEQTKEFFKKIRPGFELPTRYLLSNRLLDAEYDALNDIAMKKINSSYVLGLTCDGWTNIKRDSILNFIITTPEPIFYKSIDCGDNKHTAEYISNVIMIVIKEIGEIKFSAIVTDNASNMKAAWNIIENKYPHITCYGCVAHSLNLLVQDIVKLEIFRKVISKTKEIINEIRNTHLLMAIFKEKQKISKITISLKLPVKTRWGSNIASLESLIKNKSNLKELCIDERIENKIKKSNKSEILSDAFWERIENMHKLLKPIGVHITTIEANKPLISTVVDIFYDLENSFVTIIQLAPVLKREERKIMEFLSNRRAFSTRPIHLAANLLDPNTFAKNLKAEDDIQAIQFMVSIASCSPDIDEGLFMEELAQYRTKEGIFPNEFLWNYQYKISPLSWWKSLCSKSAPNLHNMALKIFSAPATSAACERSFSKYAHIQNAKKNKLLNVRAAKLLFVSENIHLRNNQSDPLPSAKDRNSKKKSRQPNTAANSSCSSSAIITEEETNMAENIPFVAENSENTTQTLSESKDILDNSASSPDSDSSSLNEDEDIPYADSSDEDQCSVTDKEDD